MHKALAIEVLGGGDVAATAAAIGVTYQAVNKWPDKLPRRIADRVIAAMVRQGRSLSQIRRLLDNGRKPTSMSRRA